MQNTTSDLWIEAGFDKAHSHLHLQYGHNRALPKSKESQVSEVSVWVTLVTIVEAESVDVLIMVSVVEAVEEPITTTWCVPCRSQWNGIVRLNTKRVNGYNELEVVLTLGTALLLDVDLLLGGMSIEA